MVGLCDGGNEPVGSLEAICEVTDAELRKVVAVMRGDSTEKEHLLRTSGERNKKTLVKCFVWSVALYGAETWTLRRSEEKRLEAFEKDGACEMDRQNKKRSYLKYCDSAGIRGHDRQKEGKVGRGSARKLRAHLLPGACAVAQRGEERRESDRGREGRNPKNSGGAIFWISVGISSIVLSGNYGLVIKKERQEETAKIHQDIEKLEAERVKKTAAMLGRPGTFSRLSRRSWRTYAKLVRDGGGGGCGGGGGGGVGGSGGGDISPIFF
ncbi:hypothetical protein ANN_27717 [Periplaneta americana]|uniref:Uncharacterized protein n=1 Tax=Periplaneta americana TaxID=6978 RepID=A0ABQ8RV31_PERAM|nr:hypothetical protein ANN_27717 [Periplaneta americana]